MVWIWGQGGRRRTHAAVLVEPFLSGPSDERHAGGHGRQSSCFVSESKTAQAASVGCKQLIATLRTGGPRVERMDVRWVWGSVGLAGADSSWSGIVCLVSAWQTVDRDPSPSGHMTLATYTRC